MDPNLNCAQGKEADSVNKLYNDMHDLNALQALHHHVAQQIAQTTRHVPDSRSRGIQKRIPDDRPRACRLPNNSQEWELEMCMATVDFQKAFDLVEHRSVWEALRK